MRKSSSPSLSNCNSVLANKIFGIPLDELQQEGQPDSEVPFIVRHVVDYIEEHGGLEQEGLFQVNGNAETVEWLRKRYDNGEDVDLVKEADVPSAISLLRFFLQELPEPVIPGSLHIHLMQLSQDYNNEDEFGRKLRFLLQQLPPVNYSLLKFLCRFLANVASHHEEIWSASSLAAVFGPDVFHIYTDVEDLKEQEIVSRIMAGLLENYYEFFENEEEDFSSTNDLSSITEQINDLLEEEEEDIKLEQTEELPEDSTEQPEERPDMVHDMTESILDSSSVTASTSTKVCDLNANTQSEISGDGSVNVLEESTSIQVPLLYLKNVSDGDKWEEPFPAFKSWQEDRESGEAQLSPQAGRMNSHPLEEDCHPVLSHRSLDFGQSQRFLHDPETLDSSSKALSFVRCVTREERHIVKPLYDRYRLVKQMLTRASITPILGSPSTKRRSQMLQPIIEGETAHFFEEIKEEEEDGDSLSSEFNDILRNAVQTQSISSPVENSESDLEEGQEKLTRDLRLSSIRAASMPELLEQLWKARAEKKKLRKTLREFEEGFYQQNGRNVQKEDRAPMLDEYREYKKVKAKLRLLEVLISKQDFSKSI
uniref:Protein FAM13B n=1 Tax=Chelydra serpentina TaxID=8475 RepID=A0A8C3XJY8_CHESE